MVNLLVEEPYALVRARTGLWEPRADDGPRPPGHLRLLNSMLRGPAACAEVASFSRLWGLCRHDV
jgi:hypothetical protein